MESASGPAETLQPPAKRWLLLLLLTPALLWGCWNGPFLRFDDPMIFAWSGTGSWSDALRYHPDHQFFFPLTLVSLRLDRVIFESLFPAQSASNPEAWVTLARMVNLLWHAAASAMVWMVARRLGAGARLAAFVLAAFALHPSACESVCWAIERKNVLTGFFCFLAFCIYLDARSFKLHALALLAYGAALLAKPSALGLFPVVIMWEVLGRPRINSDAGTSASASTGLAGWKGALGRVAPWVLLTAAFTAANLIWCAKSFLPTLGGSIWAVALTDVEVLRRYVQNFIWPVSLSFFYGGAPITSVFAGRFWINLLALVGFVAATVFLSEPRNRRATLFGWAWFASALGPCLNFLTITFLMQDRYAYLSAPGLWLAVGLAAQGGVSRLGAAKVRVSRLAALGVLGLAAAWTASSFVRSAAFNDSMQLFADAAEKEPQSCYAQIFYAQELQVKMRALEDPQAANLFAGHAIAAFEAGLAAPDFERYLHQPDAHLDLGYLYLRRGRFQDAITQADAALLPPPWIPVLPGQWARAERLHGMAVYRMGNLPQATAHFERAMAHAEGETRDEIVVLWAGTALELAAVFEREGNREKARSIRATAAQGLRSIPDTSKAHAAALKMLATLPPSTPP
ncbi:MAG: hypothetical protein HY291_11590 [Planctomycetes bacterium]|nr:hypothetical protein [Planctomycetota bacterium]